MTARKPPPEPPIVGRQIPGIRYFKLDGLDAPVFRCERLHCTLRSVSCASRFRVAAELAAMKGKALQNANPETLEKRGKTAPCVGCPTGAGHLGMDHREQRSRFSETFACARCGRGANRLVGSSACCISCMNREYEWLKGANAKGTRPIHAVQLRKFSVRYVVADGDPQTFSAHHAADITELMLRVLRQTQGGPIRFLPPVPAGNSDQEHAA
jgi:hypothetical protein